MAVEEFQTKDGWELGDTNHRKVSPSSLPTFTHRIEGCRRGTGDPLYTLCLFDRSRMSHDLVAALALKYNGCTRIVDAESALGTFGKRCPVQLEKHSMHLHKISVDRT